MLGQNDGQGYVSKQYAADFFGVSLRTIERLICEGELPIIKVIRSTRIPAAALHDFAARQVLKIKEWSL